MKSEWINDELYKTVEFKGATYQIQKFTAKDGLKLARLLLAKIAPIIPLLPDDEQETPDENADKKALIVQKAKEQAEKMDDETLLSAVSIALNSIDDGDMDYLIGKCLRVCSKAYPGGMQPVIDENGFYGVPEAEYDMALTLFLVKEAIVWGASDFFGESGFDLKAILGFIGK